jgi:2-polyprenyl-3-methyl-5-hydroxy-6-metoxy-1,4-benzoquinol methylase
MKNEALKASGNAAQDYDIYFKALQCDRHYTRSVYRTGKAIQLLQADCGSVLSVGVGNLGEAKKLTESGFMVTICDISPLAVQFAQKENFRAFECDITKNPPEGKYDYVFALEVLEHLVNPLAAIRNLTAALKANGKMIISLPNETNIWARLTMLIGRPTFGGHDWHHLRFFNCKFGEKLFAEADLKILKKTYCPLMPLQWSRRCGELLQSIMPTLFSLTTIWLLDPK